MSITIIIIVITVALSLYSFQQRDVMSKLIFNPYVITVRKEWYRFITHGFIHADYMHLAVNMFVLYGFGKEVEAAYGIIYGSMGTLAFATMYLAAIVIASISSYVKYKGSPNYNSLGASGATSAVLYAFILIAPWQSLYLMFIPIPIPGIVFGILYLVYSSYMSKKGGDYINHDAHFYGAVFGFIYTLLLKPQLGKLFIKQILNGLGMNADF